MARRIGVLSVSMAVLGLAVTGYFVQGAGAGGAPIAVADFSVAPSAVAEASESDEYTMPQSDLELFHATAGAPVAPCQNGAGLATLKLTDEVGVLCLGGNVLGYLVTVEGETPKVVPSDDPQAEDVTDEPCPSGDHETQPDA